MSIQGRQVDWAGWYARWEAQQERYMPHREERFRVICDTVAAFCGDAPQVLDLGCGPGSLAQRILDRLPGAHVIAVDMDPVLLAIGRKALGDRGGRLRFIDADLRTGWEAEREMGVDAAVSTTALHWLQPDALASLYSRLGTAIRRGGVFVNGDSIAFGPDHSRIAAAARSMREERGAAATDDDGEGWEQWWAAVGRESGLAAEVAERGRRHHDHPEHDHSADIDFHRRALVDAGFIEAGTIWQKLSDRVLVAVR